MTASSTGRTSRTAERPSPVPAPPAAPSDVRARVDAAVASARAAQGVWSRLGPGDRSRVLTALAGRLSARRDEITGAIRADTGKPRTEALAEIVVSVELLRFHARVAPRVLRPRRVGSGWMLWKKASVEREPWGVVGAISAWNYPFILPMDCVTPALAAGNALVLKPSELAATAARLIPELCEEAGAPAGLVQIVEGAGETGRALLAADIDRVVFTGSTETGRHVMRAAAERLVPVTLELGGKDVAIVLDDADLERAARGVAFGAFFNAGQTCLSVERAYVQDGVYDAFVDRVSELAREIRADARGEGDMGRIIAAPQLDVLSRHVDEALAAGARALTGGAPAPGADPRLWPPTVLVDVDETMAVVREESFGPLLPILRITDEDEAVRRANASPYGLFASVWTGDDVRGRRIARKLRAGGVSINEVLGHYGAPALPVGGVGASGFGRRRGVEALEEMTRTKSVLVNRRHTGGEPWWYPYGARTERLLEATLAWRSAAGVRGLVQGARVLLRGRR